MTAIAYPDTLPGPLPGSLSPRPRRAASAIEGPLQQRARQRDFAGALSRYAFIYTPAEMAEWLEWFRDVLLQGRRWFAIALPGAGGLINRVARYRDVQQEHLGAGIYRVNATFEQRGASLEPFGSLPEAAYAYYSLSAGDFDHGPYASIAEAEAVFGTFIIAQQLGAGYDECDVGAATYGEWGPTLEHPDGEQWMWLPCTCVLDGFPPQEFEFGNRIYRALLP